MSKIFTIKETKYNLHNNNPQVKETTGTLSELIEYYSYTLETGKAYEREKGNKKINICPKTIKSLVSNLSKAVDNSASNGYSGRFFELV